MSSSRSGQPDDTLLAKMLIALEPKQLPGFPQLDCESLGDQSCETLLTLPTKRQVLTKILRIAPLVRPE
jgi:hypothetical protein